MMLSATGCVDPANPHRPAAGLIPYDVASPLWSDGAAKERFLALPEGARIHVKDCAREPATCQPRAAGGTFADDGHFDLPPGTVLVKSFLIGGKRIETRLLVRFDAATWEGYSYEWNDEQTDARVFPDTVGGVKRMVATPAGTQPWFFPSRSECLQCHTEAAGISLGLETAQLDMDLRYPSGITSNQLATLENIGLFDAPLARPARGRLATPTVEEPGRSLVDRARSYLQANCANCHRPGSNFESIDLRAHIPLPMTQVCNAQPEKGTLGVAGARLLVPGNPGQSLLALRMRSLLMNGRMPQIGTSVVDEAGVRVIEAWITSLTAADCR